jgi:hypothetical protein
MLISKIDAAYLAFVSDDLLRHATNGGLQPSSFSKQTTVSLVVAESRPAGYRANDAELFASEPLDE